MTERYQSSVTEPELGEILQDEADATAFEAVRFYAFVKDLTQQGRSVGVVGNLRYGYHFVVNPLEEHLKALGVPVEKVKVSSGGETFEQKDQFTKVLHGLAEKRIQDIVIVDGTKQPHYYGVPRMGKAIRSMRSFVIEETNRSAIDPDTRIAYWTAPYKKEVRLGTQKHPFNPYRIDAQNQVIFANTTVYAHDVVGFPQEFSSHMPAYFDDPENFVNNHRCDTKGNFSTEKQFIHAVQKRMKVFIDRELQKNSANPQLIHVAR